MGWGVVREKAEEGTEQLQRSWQRADARELPGPGMLVPYCRAVDGSCNIWMSVCREQVRQRLN